MLRKSVSLAACVAAVVGVACASDPAWSADRAVLKAPPPAFSPFSLPFSLGLSVGTEFAGSHGVHSTSGFYRGQANSYAGPYAGLFANVPFARTGSGAMPFQTWIWSVTPALDFMRARGVTFSGMGGGVPVTGTGSMSQIEGLLMLKATTPLGPASAFSLFGGLGAASLRPSGAPTGVGGPMFTSNATVPVFRAGIEVSQRAAMLNIALQAFYQRTGGATFETSLPGERFEEKPNDSVRLGLTFTYDSDNNFKNNNTFNVDDGKGDTPKTTTKPGGGEKKKDGPKEGGGGNPGQPMVAIDDCIVIIQYDPGQIPTREQDPTSAQNEDFDASAKLFKGAHIEHVTSKAGEHLDDILKKFKAQGCWTRIRVSATARRRVSCSCRTRSARRRPGILRTGSVANNAKTWIKTSGTPGTASPTGSRLRSARTPRRRPRSRSPRPTPRSRSTRVIFDRERRRADRLGAVLRRPQHLRLDRRVRLQRRRRAGDAARPRRLEEKNHDAKEPEPKDEPRKGGKK